MTVVPRLLTTKELSAALGIPRWRLFELIAKGEGPPHMRIGRTYRFAEDQVVRWIHDRTRVGEKDSDPKEQLRVNREGERAMVEGQ
jgi:excisionase family DNA binding protein